MLAWSPFVKQKSKPASKKLRVKRDRKTRTVSFRVTHEFADQIAKAVESSSLSPGEFLAAGVLSVVLNIDAFEAGRIRGRQEGFDELAEVIIGHARDVERHAQTLHELFDDPWAVNDTKGKSK